MDVRRPHFIRCTRLLVYHGSSRDLCCWMVDSPLTNSTVGRTRILGLVSSPTRSRNGISRLPLDHPTDGLQFNQSVAIQAPRESWVSRFNRALAVVLTRQAKSLYCVPLASELYGHSAEEMAGSVPFCKHNRSIWLKKCSFTY